MRQTFRSTMPSMFIAATLGTFAALVPILAPNTATAAATLAKAAEVASCSTPAAISSGTATNGIIELYTSEGCDSCPVADKWFSTIPRAHSKSLVIPLAFHVDYWDYIGWKDRFSKPAFAVRQRETVTRQGSRTVYTPQVMLNGRDWRGWTANGEFANATRELSAKPARATIALGFAADTTKDTKPADQFGVRLSVSIADAAERKESAIFIAVTENNLSSRVTSGENRGATLMHDHVVRELIGPIPIRVDGTVEIFRSLEVARDWKKRDLAAVAFVQNQRTGDVLQAVSLPICQ